MRNLGIKRGGHIIRVAVLLAIVAACALYAAVATGAFSAQQAEPTVYLSDRESTVDRFEDFMRQNDIAWVSYRTDAEGQIAEFRTRFPLSTDEEAVLETFLGYNVSRVE